MKEDSFLTLESLSSAKYVDKKSVFYAFAIPVESEVDIDRALKAYRKKFYDARHLCYAFRLKPDKSLFRFSDNGEPSGTAGKSIYSAILSHDLTNILILVVRYFGGIKLGTSGLSIAYKTVAIDAVSHAKIIECHEEIEYAFLFDYNQMNNVMRYVKLSGVKILNCQISMLCKMNISGSYNKIEHLRDQIAAFVHQ